MSAVAFHSGKSEQQVKHILEDAASKLLKVRSKRPSPLLDDKIITAWNAMMITAFSKGYKITQQNKYFDAAKKCADFILREHYERENNILLHTSKEGNAKNHGYLEDYAYFANSLLDLFEIIPEISYLQEATKLAKYLIEHFWDSQNNSFFMTSDTIDEKLIIRPKSIYDLSIPSGNSVAAYLLLRLYHFTQDQSFLEISIKIMNAYAQKAAENPFAFGYLLNTLYMFIQKPIEIIVLDNNNQTNSELNRFIEEKFLPEALFVTIRNKTLLENLSKHYSFFKGKEFLDNRTDIMQDAQKNTLVFICKDFTCSLPLKTVKEVESVLSTRL